MFGRLGGFQEGLGLERVQLSVGSSTVLWLGTVAADWLDTDGNLCNVGCFSKYQIQLKRIDMKKMEEG